jgi:hypothetical protein
MLMRSLNQSSKYKYIDCGMSQLLVTHSTLSKHSLLKPLASYPLKSLTIRSSSLPTVQTRQLEIPTIHGAGDATVP